MKKLKPIEKKKAYTELLMPLTLLLIGLVLIIESVGVMLILRDISNPILGSELIIGWVYTLLKLAAGAASMVAGLVILKK